MKDSPARVGLGARLFTWSRRLTAVWARHAKVVVHADAPWTPLRKAPRECTVALVTTAGVHLTADAPFDMADRRGDPSFREIPSDTPGRVLAVTHDYDDHRDADRDVNVVLPVERLRDLRAGSRRPESTSSSSRPREASATSPWDWSRGRSGSRGRSSTSARWRGTPLQRDTRII